jgi:NAD(P)-dependent dehydrogenase (short-subunit alcohol dehydrogenase family)
MRLKDKVAIVVGAGQSPGEGMGNGRATVLRFAQEGAKVLAVDNKLSSAEETVAMARQSGGECVAFEADVTKQATLAAMVEAARQRWGRIDVLHYNVGVSIAGGDAPLAEITEAAFDRIATINLRGAIMACKHVLPVMRVQRSGVIITISSVAAWEQYPNVAYKATKAAMIAFTQQIAIQNAEFGVRANVILPGLMDTAWDVANAALFLASDEANFITGVALPVDGGALVHIN